MSSPKTSLLILALVSIAISIFSMRGFVPLKQTRAALAGVLFVDSTTERALQQDYTRAKRGGEKIKILIVPGHDREYSGTRFRDISEFDLNLELSQTLAAFLQQNPLFDITVTQNWNGYHPAFAAFFEKNREAIVTFLRGHQKTAQVAKNAGLLETRQTVEHNFAPGDMAFKLYGINKWANETDMDVVIHVHFNDAPGRKRDRIGEYGGFAIYIPERQFSNAKGSAAIGKTVFNRLSLRLAPSNLPKEQGGIVEDQDLIAIGSNNSLDAASLLIEYSYIYEPQLRQSATRSLALREMAWQTYLGITEFFEGAPYTETLPQSAILPYRFDKNLTTGIRGSADVYRTQVALALEGFYPPDGSTMDDCPINGNFLDCTVRALKAFQRVQGAPQTGVLDPFTRTALNIKYGE